MYSLGDIAFKKPVSIKKVAYTLAFLLIWALPLTLVFGIPTGIVTFVLFYALPIAAGHFATKPIFGGRGLLDFLKITFSFLLNEPKVWTDLKAAPKDVEVSSVHQEIWISRRRELKYLAQGGEN